MCVLGDIGELGAWKDLSKGQMKWTAGHIWVLEGLRVPAGKSVFQYKYVKMENGSPVQWEQGYNRLADLYLLHQQQSQLGSGEQVRESSVHLIDSWEKYTVNFSIFYPLEDEVNQFMRINGEGKELGAWNKGLGPQKMLRAKREIVWLTGMKVHPWEWFVEFD
mmetsp:Transcript_18109/g.30921  ORF Transcript_18109/g.30921 Transcript_18109/m.30921 type:complete len:163 (+) Transcript_18109:268-756(+)